MIQSLSVYWGDEMAMIRVMLPPGVREGPELVLGMMNGWLRSGARAVFT